MFSGGSVNQRIKLPFPSWFGDRLWGLHAGLPSCIGISVPKRARDFGLLFCSVAVIAVSPAYGLRAFCIETVYFASCPRE
jgi:hypothetical protein